MSKTEIPFELLLAIRKYYGCTLAEAERILREKMYVVAPKAAEPLRVRLTFWNIYYPTYIKWLRMGSYAGEASINLYDWSGSLVPVGDYFRAILPAEYSFEVGFDTEKWYTLQQYWIETKDWTDVSSPATLTMMNAKDFAFKDPYDKDVSAYYAGRFDLDHRRIYNPPARSCCGYLQIYIKPDAPRFPKLDYDVLMEVFIKPRCIDFWGIDMYTPDGQVNIFEVVKMTSRFGKRRTSPDWTEYDEWVLDLDNDGRISILDVCVITGIYGWTSTTPICR